MPIQKVQRKRLRGIGAVSSRALARSVPHDGRGRLLFPIGPPWEVSFSALWMFAFCNALDLRPKTVVGGPFFCPTLFVQLASVRVVPVLCARHASDVPAALNDEGVRFMNFDGGGSCVYFHRFFVALMDIFLSCVTFLFFSVAVDFGLEPIVPGPLQVLFSSGFN